MLKETALSQEKLAKEVAGQRGYRNALALGFAEWGQGSQLQAAQKLAEYPAEYRGWEGHVLDRLCKKDVKRWPGQPMMITAAALSNDGTRLVAATRDDSIHVWDRHTAKRLQTNRGHNDIIMALAVSPDGTLVASSGAEGGPEFGVVVVWELATGHMLQRLGGSGGYFHGLDFSPDSKNLAVGATNGVVTVWNPRTGEPVKSIKGHTGNARSVRYSPDGKFLAWTCKDEALELWEVETATRRCRFLPPTPAARTEAGAFSPDGKYVAVTWWLPTDRGEVGLWDLTGPLVGELKQPHKKLPEHANQVRAVAWSGDSQLLATGDAAGVVQVRDVAADKAVGRMEAHALAVTSLAFEKTGRAIISAGADGRLRVWDATTGRPAGEVVGSYAPVRCVAVSPDGKHVASGSAAVGASTGVLIREFETGRVVHGLYAHRHSIRSLSYSGDGTRLASASEDRTVVIWDPKAGKQLKTITIAPAKPITVALNHDGALLLVTDTAGAVRLWSFADNQFIGKWHVTVNASPGAFGVAFEPGGTRFVTTAIDQRLDGWVKVWEPAKTEPVLAIKQSAAAPESFGPTVAWSNDRKLIAAVGRQNNGEIRTSDFASEVLIWNSNTKDGKPARRLPAPPGIDSVSFGADSSSLVMSSNRGKVYYWDLKTGTAYPLAGHTRAANGAVVHPDGVHVISCGEDATVRVWHRYRSRDSLTFNLNFHRAAIDPDGNLLATAGGTGPAAAVSVWDLGTGEKVFNSATPGEWNVTGIAYRPGRQLVTVAPEFKKAVLETKAPRFEVVVRAVGQPEPISRQALDGYGAGLSPDGRFVTRRLRDDHIQVYDIDARKVACELAYPADQSPISVFNADATRLAVATRLNATVYELPSDRKLYDLRGHSADIVPMAFSNDGRWIATGTTSGPNIQTAPGSIYVWDAATGRRVHIINGHKSSVTRLAFTHDGKRLVSAGDDATLRVWDTATGEPVVRLPVTYRHPGTGITFDRAGRLLVTELDAVRVWDGRPITDRLPDFSE